MKSFVKLFCGLGLALCLAQAAFAATYTVTKIADTNDGVCDAADCSLREAVAAANATADNDTIEFSSLFGAATIITLSGTDLIITNNGTLTINGTGAVNLTVSGNNASRVFTNNAATATISNLRVTGGNGASSLNNGLGGGIRTSGGTLTLINLVVTGNSATNGGGLSNGGTGSIMNVTNCAVTNNTVTGTGGGIQNFSTSTLNVLNSTFSGNTSNNTALAGGAMQGNGMIFMSNTTISGNNAPNGSAGAIYYNGSGLTMNNVTIANNASLSGSGGLHKSTSTLNANIRNTIIANNTGSAATPDVFGVINSQGNNLIGAVGTSTGWVASDLLNVAALLAPLANNGGATQTHALLPNSPAFNAGQDCVVTATCGAANPPTALTTDQRGAGFPRKVGSAVDVGAFELSASLTTIRPPVDFDGDGRSDYAVFRPTTGAWYLNRSTAGSYGAQFGISTDNPVPADFDGDGKADIAVWRDASFANFYILNSSDNTVRIEQFGTTGDIPVVVGDWDGDGKADPAIYRRFVGIPENPPPNVFYYRPSGSPGVNFRSINWGAGNDLPVVGDYDGDGKRDAAVFRLSTGIWYIRQSSNNQPRYEIWGASSDRTIPADYDGDGKTDVAIFRDGLWAILQSSNNQQRYQSFGQAADRLVPADYDGDGKIDLAVWRNGVFYVLRSNGNQTETQPFGANNDVPVASVQFF